MQVCEHVYFIGFDAIDVEQPLFFGGGHPATADPPHMSGISSRETLSDTIGGRFFWFRRRVEAHRRSVNRACGWLLKSNPERANAEVRVFPIDPEKVPPDVQPEYL